ncbi:MAG: peptidylprolyl isomerase [Oscillospiraceae bacterium]|nr:peptidylprolyl isomerase [Oscillospiraceae bacterium]
MKKRIIAWLLLSAMLMSVLYGCGGDSHQEATTEGSATAETVQIPPETIPADGDPSDVTCKGSYTSREGRTVVVARVEDAELTNEQLAVWYWAAVAQYRREPHLHAPDYTRPLDTQICELDSSVNSWQQYFLRQALNAWHTSQALLLQAQRDELPLEAAYKPNATTHARCMEGKPATAFLYGYQKVYQHNTMHQAYVDSLPENIQKLAAQKGYADGDAFASAYFGSSGQALLAAAGQYNSSYMYLTFLNYGLEVSDQDVENYYTAHRSHYNSQGITQESGSYVNIRHILLIPESSSDEDVQACQQRAEKLLRQWKLPRTRTEAGFAELAYRHSQDSGTAATGGSYKRLAKGQLHPQLEQWCFDAVRSAGDTVILTTEQGIHILYFCGAEPIWQAHARDDLMAQRQMEPMAVAKERFPIQIDYSAICIPEAAADVPLQELLYPDVAHQRYPEVPLYLQQDYPSTMYGHYKISSNGCGITTFSMLTTYMTDEEWTPPEMCDMYGRYSFSNGTDGMIFINEPPVFGYFLREKTYDYHVAKQALADGYIVISIQSKGYWTGGGHYILLEKLTEDGLVQVRDSNIANYLKLDMHQQDKHEWSSIIAAGSGYWIFEPKMTRVNACSRCGSPDEIAQAFLQQDYLCERCRAAVVRRDAYVDAMMQ